jgi:hypothetical protein
MIVIICLDRIVQFLSLDSKSKNDANRNFDGHLKSFPALTVNVRSLYNVPMDRDIRENNLCDPGPGIFRGSTIRKAGCRASTRLAK